MLPLINFQNATADIHHRQIMTGQLGETRSVRRASGYLTRPTVKDSTWTVVGVVEIGATRVFSSEWFRIYRIIRADCSTVNGAAGMTKGQHHR